MIPTSPTVAYAASHRAKELLGQVRTLERAGQGSSPKTAALRDQAMEASYRAKALREAAPDAQRAYLNDLFERPRSR